MPAFEKDGRRAASSNSEKADDLLILSIGDTVGDRKLWGSKCTAVEPVMFFRQTYDILLNIGGLMMRDEITIILFSKPTCYSSIRVFTCVS